MAACRELPSADALGRMSQQGRLVEGTTRGEFADRLETVQKSVWASESGNNTIVLGRILAIMPETGVRVYLEIDSAPQEQSGVTLMWETDPRSAGRTLRRTFRFSTAIHRPTSSRRRRPVRRVSPVMRNTAFEPPRLLV